MKYLLIVGLMLISLSGCGLMTEARSRGYVADMMEQACEAAKTDYRYRQQCVELSALYHGMRTDLYISTQNPQVIY